MNETTETEYSKPSVSSQLAGVAAGAAVVLIGLRVAVEIKRRRKEKKVIDQNLENLTEMVRDIKK